MEIALETLHRPKAFGYDGSIVDLVSEGTCFLLGPFNHDKWLTHTPQTQVAYIGNYCLQAYLSFIQHKSPKIICKSMFLFFGWFDTEISPKDRRLACLESIEMNWQQNL